jgi:hypothetical protein
MMPSNKLTFAPLRVVVRKGSPAARSLTRDAGLHKDALATGLKPSPKQDLIFHGGKTIQNLSFVNFYVAGQTAWDTGDIQNIDRALAAAMSDKNLNNVMMQYFKNEPITSKLASSVKLPGTAPSSFSQGDAEGLVQTLFSHNMLAGFDLTSTVINLLLPPGTVLTTDEAPTSSAFLPDRSARTKEKDIPHEDEASSQNGLGGYHGSVHQTMSGVGQTVYYAVGVFSQTTPDGQVNGIPAFPEPWKSVVATFYHELNEARTDADVEDAIRTSQDSFLGWTSAQGEECGDFPIDETNGDLSLVFKEVPLADGSGTVPVQFQYSNAVHGPEGPIANPHPLP